MTNNETEYEDILIGLRVSKALRAKTALLKSDSKLTIGQINKEFKTKEKKDIEPLKVNKPAD